MGEWVPRLRFWDLASGKPIASWVEGDSVFAGQIQVERAFDVGEYARAVRQYVRYLESEALALVFPNAQMELLASVPKMIASQEFLTVIGSGFG